jgi:hypothetical protein
METPKTRPSTDQVSAATRTLLDYMYEDEKEDYQDRKAAGESVDNHIYHALETLRLSLPE